MKHRVYRLYAFGSVLSTQFDSKSDIDFIVEFQPLPVKEYADNYFELKFALQDTLKREIDLLEENAIRNPYFKLAIEKHRELIYGD